MSTASGAGLAVAALGGDRGLGQTRREQHVELVPQREDPRRVLLARRHQDRLPAAGRNQHIGPRPPSAASAARAARGRRPAATPRRSRGPRSAGTRAAPARRRDLRSTTSWPSSASSARRALPGGPLIARDFARSARAAACARPRSAADPGASPRPRRTLPAGGGAASASPSTVPCITSSISALSLTVRASAPYTLSPSQPSRPAASRRARGSASSRPGRSRRRGSGSSRRRPSRSRTATMPAATAAAEPPEDPPGVREGSHGLRVIPFASLAVQGKIISSGTLVIPIGIAPAARSRRTASASARAAAARRCASPRSSPARRRADRP